MIDRIVFYQSFGEKLRGEGWWVDFLSQSHFSYSAKKIV
jgi:hypothetical protein